MTSSLAATDQSRVAAVDEIRAQFPALERHHRGRPVAYFDGPGGTQVPRAVTEAMADYMLHHNANTHWRYPSSHETDAMLESAREALADLLGADRSEVAFGANMTTLTFHLARGLGRSWGPGDGGSQGRAATRQGHPTVMEERSSSQVTHEKACRNRRSTRGW